jgi:hypothetical protein
MNDSWSVPEPSLSMQVMVEAAKRQALQLPPDEARQRLAKAFADNVEMQHALKHAIMRICHLEIQLTKLRYENGKAELDKRLRETRWDRLREWLMHAFR